MRLYHLVYKLQSRIEYSAIFMANEIAFLTEVIFMHHKWYNATEVEVGSLNFQSTIFIWKQLRLAGYLLFPFLLRVRKNIKVNAIFGKIERKLSH